jgi:Zn-dependent M28 family amino/carboxypeptidase
MQKIRLSLLLKRLNILGRTKDMTIVGLGNSRLDDYAAAVLKKNGRYATPDPAPEKGGYFRSDHFSFAKVGVPSLYLSKGVDDVEHGKEWAMAQSEKWTMENYHKPSDNYEPDKWNFDGMIEDIKVCFETGYDLSISDEFPDWRPGSPFKQLRDKMMMK